jgi:hypothetical protein
MRRICSETNEGSKGLYFRCNRLMEGNIMRRETEEPNEDKVRCRFDSDPNVDAIRFCTRGRV